MNNNPPKLIAINHDDYHARHIGRTADGRQFFLTTPFDPGTDERPGRQYIALYLFDAAGKLLEAKIDDCEPGTPINDKTYHSLYEARLQELGAVTFERIEVAPFAIERFGIQFGLVPRKPEDKDGEWAVEVQPGNYMAFFKPWDSGNYDT